jgi:hypothetical protein
MENMNSTYEGEIMTAKLIEWTSTITVGVGIAFILLYLSLTWGMIR